MAYGSTRFWTIFIVKKVDIQHEGNENSKYAKNEACRSIASLTGTAPKDVKEALENALKEKKNKAEIVFAYSEAAKLMGLTQNEVKEAVQGLVNSRQCCAMLEIMLHLDDIPTPPTPPPFYPESQSVRDVKKAVLQDPNGPRSRRGLSSTRGVAGTSG